MPGSAEGVFARRFEDGARCGARGPGATYPVALGRRRPPPAGTRTRREELADSVGPVGPGWKRGPALEDAAMERREAPAFSKRERGKTEDWCATRRSIPSA